LIIIIVAPAGKSSKKEKVIPKRTEMSELIAPIIIAVLKLLANCRAVTAGNIKSAETSITPTILTDKTTVSEVSKVKIALIKFVFTPVVLAYSSSKVAENKSQ